jgi:hypothetical protein
MMNQKISEQNWSNVKGEIQKSFSNLSADELESTHGDASLLTDLVAQKAGLDPADAEKRLDEIIARYRSEASGHSFYEEDDFEDYVADADDERFGTDEGLTSPASHPFSADSASSERSDERTPRQDIKNTQKNAQSGRAEKPDRSSSSEFSSERRSPDTNPVNNPKKTDRNI